MEKQAAPDELYHGSSREIVGALKPALLESTPDHISVTPSVFGTARKDVAALFMFPLETLASIGFEKDISYICIWGTREEFDTKHKDTEGFIYVLPGDSFRKIGKEYEWQSFKEVVPLRVEKFDSVLEGMMTCGVQVYFINDESIFDHVVADKDNRAPLLKELLSENQKTHTTIKNF